MKKILFLIFFLCGLKLSAQNSVSEVLSFQRFNDIVADSSGTVIRTKFPFDLVYYMPTIKIEGYNYGSSEPIDLTLNWYIYQNASNQPTFVRTGVISGGGYSPVVQVFNENGFVSIYLRRGLISQYVQNFRVKAWLRTSTDGGSTPAWFTGWTAAAVEAPPIGNNWVTVPYVSKFENLNSASDATINGIRIGIGKGASNAYYGSSAFANRTTGTYNTALGASALQNLTVGEFNVAIGSAALLESIGGSRNIAIGYEALRGYGNSATVVNNFNTAIGFRALRGNTAALNRNTGTQNIAMGYDAMYVNESGNGNIAVGQSSLYKNRKGGYNISMGIGSLLENVSKSYNIAIGHSSQYNANSDSVISNTYNTSVGAFSLTGSSVPSSNTGLVNNAFGAYALNSNTSGSQQNAFGTYALQNSSGNHNAAFGNSAGLDVISGTNNVLLGHNTGRGIVSGSGNTIIGASITGLPATLSNTVILGSAGVERLRINATGGVGIGTTSIPADVKLAVSGSIIADKIRVKKSTGGVWPDYVFEEDYQLRDLRDLSTFLKKNKHLPEIPSAKEVETEGQDLGEMNRLLLKKVEELTLYLIEQNEKYETLKKRITILELEK